MSLKSARETNAVKQKVPTKKKAADTIKQQLRSFAPWINRFGCVTFRLLVKAGKCNAAVASESLFVTVGALCRSSAEEDMDEMCEALFGKTVENFEKMAMEMAKLSDDQTSYKWRIVSTLILPNDRSVDQESAEKLDDRFGVKVQKAASADISKTMEQISQFFRKESGNHLGSPIPAEVKDKKKFGKCMTAAVGVYVHPWWQSRFERKDTVEETFYETMDKTHQVETMHRDAAFPFVQADLCSGVAVRVLGLPCREGGATVYFMLPEKRFNLQDVISHLTGDRAARLFGYCRPRRVRISIPKLHLTFDAELRKPFSAMGVDAWLNRNHPAFVGMTRGDAVALGQIFNRVVLKMNEDGDKVDSDVDESDAAAEFKCDQPFLVFFHHTTTNAVWMMAEITQPSAKGPGTPTSDKPAGTEQGKNEMES